MRLRRIAILASAASIAIPAFLVPASADSGRGACVTTTRTGTLGTWTQIPLPSYSVGPNTTTLHAIDPVDPMRWWVTNGVVVKQSLDGGCTWHDFYTLPSQPTPAAPYSRTSDSIVRLAVPANESGHSTLFASVRAITQVPNSTGLTFVLSGSQTLGPAGSLAQPTGEPGPLVVAPSNAKVIYAIAGGIVNVSTDGGASWTARPITPGRDGATVARHLVGSLAVDPSDASSVWAIVDDSHLMVTRDAFVSAVDRIDVEQSGWQFVGLNVAHDRGRSTRVSVFESSGVKGAVRSVARSSDDGGHFALTHTPTLGIIDGVPESTAHSPSLDVVFPTTNRGDPNAFPRTSIYAEASPAKYGDVDQFQLAPLHQIQADLHAAPRFYFLAATNLVVWQPPEANLTQLVPLLSQNPVVDVPGLRPLPGLETKALTSPQDTAITMKVGSSRRSRYLVSVPPQFTRLDVFFMMDTSTSMDDVINALANSFVDVSNELVARRIDVNIGLGEFQDWNGNGVRYRRLVDISPPGPAFKQALQEIQTDGGYEPMYTALDQMATGSGIPDPGEGSPVAAGQNAHWRDGAYRVVVNTSDEDPEPDSSSTSSNPRIDPDGPTLIQAGNDLRAHAIRHVGFVVRRQAAPAGAADPVVDPQADFLTKRMTQLSLITGAVASAGGVDCNGDGTIDIQPGQALVCPLYTGQTYLPGATAPSGASQLHGANLSRPLISLLSSITTFQSATLRDLLPHSHPGLDVRIDPMGDYSRLNARFPEVLGFDVTFACTGIASTVDRSNEVLLSPVVQQRFSPPAHARVTCQAPVGAPGRGAGQDPLVGGVVVQQPAVNPPAPVQPVQVQQPAQLQNPAANPQVGAAEEEEAALAYAGAAPLDESNQEETTLAMSLLGCSVVAGFGCAVAVRRGRRPRFAVVTEGD